jgi:hypothetical protein
LGRIIRLTSTGRTAALARPFDPARPFWAKPDRQSCCRAAARDYKKRASRLPATSTEQARRIPRFRHLGLRSRMRGHWLSDEFLSTPVDCARILGSRTKAAKN